MVLLYKSTLMETDKIALRSAFRRTKMEPQVHKIHRKHLLGVEEAPVQLSACECLRLGSL